MYTVFNFNLQHKFSLGDALSKVVAGIAIAVISGIGALLGGLLLKFQNDWKYMTKLRKSHIKRKLSEDNCECYLLCGLIKIFFGHFFCRCCYCKISKNGKKKTGKTYEIEDWESFIKNETIPITLDDLNYMKQKYINYRYSHKHYCFQNPGKRCNHSQCFHYETINLKGLIQHPVLYLLVLNFDTANESCDQLNIEDLKHDSKSLTWKHENKKALEFIFKVMLEPTYSENQDYRNIEKSLEKKINNICLVIEDFPRKYRDNLEDNEKFILQTILTLHKYHKVPLIYNVRYGNNILIALFYFKYIIL